MEMTLKAGDNNLKMKNLLFFLLVLLASCQVKTSKMSDITIEQQSLSNEKIKSYTFLECMYNDGYYPSFLVDKCKRILLSLCKDIETSKPENLDALYKLTHTTTEQINALEDEFNQIDSEIETVARECLAENFEHMASVYGFNADIEELIATREW